MLLIVSFDAAEEILWTLVYDVYFNELVISDISSVTKFPNFS